MQLTGLTSTQVDKIIADFTKLMQQETRAAVFAAAQQLVKLNDDIVLVASPFDTLSAITTSWSQSVQTKLVPFLKNVYAKASQAVSAPLGVDVPTTPEVLDDVTVVLQAYANELWDAGQGAVLIGWQDGETIGVMADRVQDVAKAKSKKAASIAQTAVTTVVNGSEWSTMLAVASKFNAVTTKEWVATHDSHTRPTHFAADGQVVALNQKFVVGDALLDFPGDPLGDLDEIINCRCTTRYDSDIQAVNSSPQTSPDALSADSEYQSLEQISASAATNPNWKSSDHPRGKDGKFIKKGVGLPNYVFSALTHLGGGGSFSSMSGVDQSSFLAAVPEITDTQWANLKDDQKLAIEQAIGDALDAGVPGSAAAQKHLDLLASDDDEAEPDLFNPDTPLPGVSVDEQAVIDDIDAAYEAGKITDSQHAGLIKALKTMDPDIVQEELDDIVTDNAIVDATPLTPHQEFLNNQVMNAIDDAYGDGDISKAQKTQLEKLVKEQGGSVAKMKLNEMIAKNTADDEEDEPSTTVTKQEAEKAIYDAYDVGEISEDQQDALLEVLDEQGPGVLMDTLAKEKDKHAADTFATNTALNNASSPVTGTPSAPLTTGSPKPLKITHGFIHAKHETGATLARDQNGNEIVWNGTSYDIYGPNGDVVASNIKKSKMYALLNDFYKGSNWHEPSNESVAVTHATPLDAAPPANPIPHPVAPSFPAPSTVDSALDDAFGPMNPGLAAPSSTINVPSAAVDPLSLGELPTATEADLLASLKKLHDVGFINDKDYKDLTDGVKSGKLFMGKMVVGSHNTKVQQANYVAPPLTPTHIPNPTFTPGPKPIGTPLTALAVVTHSGDFASGEVHATGTNPWGDAWSVAPAPGGNLYVQQDGQPYATAMSYPDFVALTNDQQIQWEAMDGSVSIFPAMGMAAKKTAPPAPTPAPPATITPAQEKEFYKHFKAENVSPAWSGAKIYASMQAAKLKMAGNPAFANLTDAQMLAILDKQHNLAKATSGTPYSTKTEQWLLTPNGIKAFKAANGIATTPTYAPSKVAKKTFGKKAFGKKAAPSYTPFTPPSPTKSAPVKATKAAPVKALPGVPIVNPTPWVVAKKTIAAKKVAPAKKAVATGITPSEALGDTADAPASTDTADVYSQFKASGYGKYLNESTPEEIYWNATQIGKTMNLSPAQVLAIIDAEGAKKFGVPNAKSFEKKVSDWLATNSGQVTAARVKSGDWKPNLAKKTTSGASHKYSAATPLNEKVDDVSGHVPPFDENMTSADFPVVAPTAGAALWAEMQAAHGDMQDNQKASLYHYTTNPGYAAMNNYLRGQQGASQATQNHIDAAQAGMRPSTRNITIHRGNGPFTDGAGRPWTSYETISQYVGTDLHQEAFFSASVGGKEAFSGKLISMEIEVPAGTPMAYVNAFSQYGNKGGDPNKGEREMLLAANLTYRILEVKKDGYQTIVRMRVVPNTNEASS